MLLNSEKIADNLYAHKRRVFFFSFFFFRFHSVLLANVDDSCRTMNGRREKKEQEEDIKKISIQTKVKTESHQATLKINHLWWLFSACVHLFQCLRSMFECHMDKNLWENERTKKINSFSLWNVFQFHLIQFVITLI